MSDFVYAVAINVNPLVWMMQCDICDDLVGESTTDGDVIDRLEAEHNKFHGLADEAVQT